MSAAEELYLELDIQTELNRKVRSALEQLRMRYDTGQITEHQLAESIRSLYKAVYGLVTDDLLQKVADCYEPEVRQKASYHTQMYKGDNKIDVCWVVEDEVITIYDSYCGDEKHFPIPLEKSPHEYYTKVLESLEIKGWHYEQ